MTHVTCRLTTKNHDQLRNPTLGIRVRATFTFLSFFLLKRNSVCARCIVGKVIHGVSVPLATARPQRVTRASNVGPPACATSRMTRASNRRRNRRSLPSSSVERSTPPSQTTYVDAAFLHTSHAARNARVCCGHRCALPKRTNRSRCRSRHQETTLYV